MFYDYGISNSLQYPFLSKNSINSIGNFSTAADLQEAPDHSSHEGFPTIQVFSKLPIEVLGRLLFRLE
jgi:hypothetical protein